MTTKEKETKVIIAKFAFSLLRTCRAERSNSARRRLFTVLCDTVARHGDGIPEEKYLRGLLHESGPFDKNESRFRHCVKTAVQLFGRSAQICQIGETIDRLLGEVEMELLLTRADASLEKINARAKSQYLAEDVVREIEAQTDRQNKLHREIARI
jgi:hypothetical protein